MCRTKTVRGEETVKPEKSLGGYLCTSMIYFFYFFSMAAFGSMLSVYLLGVGKSASEVSWIVSASGLFTMILGPAAGILYDRTGLRRTLSIVLLVLSAATGLLFALTRNTALLFLLHGLSMLFLNSVNPMCEQIAAASPYRYGVLRLWGAVGYACGTQASGLLLEHASPLWCFVLFAATALLTGGFFRWAGLQNTAPAVQKTPSEKGSAAVTRPLLLFAAFSFLFSGVTTASGTYVPVLLQEKLGSTSLAGTVLFLGTLMEIPVIFLSNRFMDRLSGRSLLALNTGLLLIQMLAYSFSGSVPLLCGVLILTKSVTTMLAIMVTLKVVMILTGGRYTTTAMSVLATVKSVGGVVLTNVAGTIVDKTGLNMLFSVLLGLSAAAFLLALTVRVPADGKTYFSGSTTEAADRKKSRR